MASVCYKAWNYSPMKTSRWLGSILLLLSTINHQPSTFAQGSLTPTGAPTPTMKTLDQVEARTPVDVAHTPGDANSAFIINAPGSYYLTDNIAVSAGNGVTISASGVTLDLNGFTITSSASTASGTAVNFSGSLQDITILNGHIRGGVTLSGTTFSAGPGFQNGISVALFTTLTNARVSGVSVSGMRFNAINLGVDNTVVEQCTVRTSGSSGIVAQTVRACSAIQCGGTAINGGTVSVCYGVSVAGATGISATTSNNCVSTSDTGTGVSGTTATNCFGQSTASGTTGKGVDVITANNCWGVSDAGTGLNVNSAINCYGRSTSGVGLNAKTASNCEGISTSGEGLHASTASNCEGDSTSGDGLDVDSTATNCAGSTFGNNSFGVRAFIAIGCYGSSGYTGIFSNTAIGCYGNAPTPFNATHRYLTGIGPDS
jgi:hypothetical protein